MKTKRLIAGLVSVVTLAAVTSSAIVSAANDFTVKIGKTEVAAGEEFTLTMDLENIPATGINACEFSIAYDSSLISIDKVELGKLAKDVGSVEVPAEGSEAMPSPIELNISADCVNVMYALGSSDNEYFLTGTGTFLDIKGTVKKDAKPGSEATLKVEAIDRPADPDSATAANKILFACVSGDGKPTEYTPAYEDGVVKVKGGENDPTDPKPTEPDPTDPKPTEPDPTEPQPTEDIPDGICYGNVDNDEFGNINVADLVALNTYLLNKEKNPLSPEGKANADVVRDNIIDAADGSLLLNYLAEQVGKDELGKK